MLALRTHELLEREAELAAVSGLIDREKDGVGRLVVVEARTGMGKTRLLAEARGRAAAAGFLVLTARGGELEHEFSYGVVAASAAAPSRSSRSFGRSAASAGSTSCRTLLSALAAEGVEPTRENAPRPRRSPPLRGRVLLG